MPRGMSEAPHDDQLPEVPADASSDALMERIRLRGDEFRAVLDNGEKRRDAADRYREAWVDAIRFSFQSTDDQKKRFISQWDGHLGEGPLAASQICALAGTWHPELMTARLTVLFEETRSREVIAAVCYVVARHGSDGHVRMLEAKRDSLADPELKQEVQNALNWWRYWQSGDRSDPGPAAAPPRLVR